jgi:hypothetical protein
MTMDIQSSDTAVVFIDPQNDVLSEHGANWGAVGASVTENHTVENMERIFKAAKANGYEVFISPHYFYPTDSAWKFNGPLETEEFRTRTFARRGPLTLEGFANSGADWLDRFKPYIEDGKTCRNGSTHPSRITSTPERITEPPPGRCGAAARDGCGTCATAMRPPPSCGPPSKARAALYSEDSHKSDFLEQHRSKSSNNLCLKRPGSTGFRMGIGSRLCRCGADPVFMQSPCGAYLQHLPTLTNFCQNLLGPSSPGVNSVGKVDRPLPNSTVR